MVMSADAAVSDEDIDGNRSAACPTCGSCSGMFTANSMNCLTEALGLALPGNGTIVATHKNRLGCLKRPPSASSTCTRAYYENGDESVLPRLHRDPTGLPQCHEPRYRHGRLDQHGVASLGDRARGKGQVHHEGHRRAVEKGARCCAKSRRARSSMSRMSIGPAASWRSLASSTARSCLTQA